MARNAGSSSRTRAGSSPAMPAGAVISRPPGRRPGARRLARERPPPPQGADVGVVQGRRRLGRDAHDDESVLDGERADDVAGRGGEETSGERGVELLEPALVLEHRQARPPGDGRDRLPICADAKGRFQRGVFVGRGQALVGEAKPFETVQLDLPRHGRSVDCGRAEPHERRVELLDGGSGRDGRKAGEVAREPFEAARADSLAPDLALGHVMPPFPRRLGQPLAGGRPP